MIYIRRLPVLKKGFFYTFLTHFSMTRGNLIKKKDGNMVGLFSQGNQYK